MTLINNYINPFTMMILFISFFCQGKDMFIKRDIFTSTTAITCLELQKQKKEILQQWQLSGVIGYQQRRYAWLSSKQGIWQKLEVADNLLPTRWTVIQINKNDIQLEVGIESGFSCFPDFIVLTVPHFDSKK